MKAVKKEKILDYPFTIPPLSKEDGDGYLIEFPDLPGCMSDGETIEEAIENGHDAVISWMHAAKEIKRPIPKPGELEKQSGKWIQRVLKSMHLRLIEKAAKEGVSLNIFNYHNDCEVSGRSKLPRLNLIAKPNGINNPLRLWARVFKIIICSNNSFII